MSPAPEDDGTTGRLSWLATTARLTWAHLTAILGAFSLVTVLTHITGAQIQGWLTGLIDSWNRVIRPPTEWVLRHILTVPLHAVFDITVVCPLWIRDYLSTGAVLTLSILGRAIVDDAFQETRWELRHTHSSVREVLSTAVAVAGRLGTMLWLLCLAVVAWPLFLLALIVLYSIRDDVPILVQPAQERRRFLLSLAPLGYFVVFALIGLVTG